MCTSCKPRPVFTGKVAAGIIEQDGKYLIAQRAKKDSYENCWEFPGGKQEEGETLEECLARELYEELHINATIGNHVCSWPFEYNGRSMELIAFKVISYEGTIECKEHKEIRWVPIEELPKYTFPEADIIILESLKKLV